MKHFLEPAIFRMNATPHRIQFNSEQLRIQSNSNKHHSEPTLNKYDTTKLNFQLKDTNNWIILKITLVDQA